MSLLILSKYYILNRGNKMRYKKWVDKNFFNGVQVEEFKFIIIASVTDFLYLLYF